MKVFKIIFLTTGLMILFFTIQGCGQDGNEITDPPKIVEFLGDQPMTRAGRPFVVLATVSKPAAVRVRLSVKLKLPDGIHTEGVTKHRVELPAYGKTTLWKGRVANEADLMNNLFKVPQNQLGSRMLLLDNWNEWGEGHHIAPCTENGRIKKGMNNNPVKIYL